MTWDYKQLQLCNLWISTGMTKANFHDKRVPGRVRLEGILCWIGNLCSFHNRLKLQQYSTPELLLEYYLTKRALNGSLARKIIERLSQSILWIGVLRWSSTQNFRYLLFFLNIHKASPNTDHNIICMFLKRKTISKPEKYSLSYIKMSTLIEFFFDIPIKKITVKVWNYKLCFFSKSVQFCIGKTNSVIFDLNKTEK